MARTLPWLIIALVAFTLLAVVGRAQAAPALQTTDTPTPTPMFTPTPTPIDQTAVVLDSGNTLIVERRWSFGELAIFLAILAHAALDGLLRIYELARREGREVHEVHIAS